MAIKIHASHPLSLPAKMGKNQEISYMTLEISCIRHADFSKFYNYFFFLYKIRNRSRCHKRVVFPNSIADRHITYFFGCLPYLTLICNKKRTTLSDRP